MYLILSRVQLKLFFTLRLTKQDQNTIILLDFNGSFDGFSIYLIKKIICKVGVATSSFGNWFGG